MVTKHSDTATAIFEAATQLVLEQGDAGLRVDAVAAAAGCNKRLIYHYFSNRERLVAAVYQQQCSVLRLDGNGLSESTRLFLDQQLLRLWPELASSEYPHPLARTGSTRNEDLPRALNRALLLLLPLLLRGVARLKDDPDTAHDSVSDWQKVSAELIAGVFAADTLGKADRASVVSKRSQTSSKPRYRMASASRLVD